ncbi:hypothetical protein CRG98_046811, partial [Punica granatum]
MEALSFSSLMASPANKVRLVAARKGRSLQVRCQGGGNVSKSVGISSSSSGVFTERERPTDHTRAVMEAGSLVLSPNGTSENITTKELMPYAGGHGHSLVEMDEGIGIVRFLRGKRFFITGATGFLAKVLVEKILRTVPDVGKIFLLIKAKDKEAAMGRLTNEIMNSELFKCLRQTYGASYEPFLRSKLVPVVGDVCESNLGLDEDLADFIAKEVDIIVNSAANTTFDERYDVAIDINTRGAHNIMSFAKRCKKVKLFLQVSTAYVNGRRQGKILEKPFGIGDSITRESFTAKQCNGSFPKLDVEREINLALSTKEGLEDHAAAQKMKELGLDRAKKFGWQDTYVFTKAMGEMVIDDMRGEIPVVIIRPSVIESTWKEPFPGWMEGNRMMDPIVLYYGKGQLTGFLVDPNGVLDV